MCITIFLYYGAFHGTLISGVVYLRVLWLRDPRAPAKMTVKSDSVGGLFQKLSNELKVLTRSDLIEIVEEIKRRYKIIVEQWQKEANKVPRIKTMDDLIKVIENREQ